MLAAHTGNPRRWVGGSFLILLALFGCTLLERLFFLTPDACASFESGFEEFLFLLLFQTLFVELRVDQVHGRHVTPRSEGAYLVIRRVNEREGGLLLRGKIIDKLHRIRKTDAHHDVVAVIGGFLPCFFQVGFELLDSLIKGCIVIETFRLEQTL
jgi:hypothetical protein